MQFIAHYKSLSFIAQSIQFFLDIRLCYHYIDSYETHLRNISSDNRTLFISFPVVVLIVSRSDKSSSLISSAACLFFSTFGLVPRVLKLFIGEIQNGHSNMLPDICLLYDWLAV